MKYNEFFIFKESCKTGRENVKGVLGCLIYDSFDLILLFNSQNAIKPIRSNLRTGRCSLVQLLFTDYCQNASCFEQGFQTDW